MQISVTKKAFCCTLNRVFQVQSHWNTVFWNQEKQASNSVSVYCFVKLCPFPSLLLLLFAMVFSLFKIYRIPCIKCLYGLWECEYNNSTHSKVNVFKTRDGEFCRCLLSYLAFCNTDSKNIIRQNFVSELPAVLGSTLVKAVSGVWSLAHSKWMCKYKTRISEGYSMGGILWEIPSLILVSSVGS